MRALESEMEGQQKWREKRERGSTTWKWALRGKKGTTHMKARVRSTLWSGSEWVGQSKQPYINSLYLRHSWVCVRRAFSPNKINLLNSIQKKRKKNKASWTLDPLSSIPRSWAFAISVVHGIELRWHLSYLAVQTNTWAPHLIFSFLRPAHPIHQHYCIYQLYPQSGHFFPTAAILTCHLTWAHCSSMWTGFSLSHLPL